MRNRWALIFVIGILVGGIGAVWLGVQLFSTFNGTDHEVPGEFAVDAEPGPHLIFEQTGDGNRVGVVTFSNTWSRRVTEIDVIGPDGEPVELRQPARRTTLSINERSYIAIARFDVVEPGPHRFVVESSEPSVVRVTPDLLSRLGPTVAAIGLALLGGAMALVGGIMWWTKRPRAPRAPVSVPPPPGATPPPPPPPP